MIRNYEIDTFPFLFYSLSKARRLEVSKEEEPRGINEKVVSTECLSIQLEQYSREPVLVHVDTARSVDGAGVLVDVGLGPSSEGLEAGVVLISDICILTAGTIPGARCRLPTRAACGSI